MSNVTITMRLYGAFRQYQDSISLTVPSGSGIIEIKDALGQALGPQARNLVADSVIADDSTILSPNFVADTDLKLSILPPVCGG